MIDAITNARLVGLHPEMVKRFVNLNGQFSSWAPAGTFLRITVGLRTWAQLDEKFQTAVAEFKIAIAGLNVTVAAMDKEYERRMFGVK